LHTKGEFQGLKESP